MDDIIAMEQHMKELKRRDEIAKKGYEEARRLLQMPFHKRIQEKGQEKELKRTEFVQQDAMRKLIKKGDELKHLKDEEIHLFAEFWAEFLKGKIVSINDFFYEDRLAPIHKRKLKGRFKNDRI